jgi:hypothetical protein
MDSINSEIDKTKLDEYKSVLETFLTDYRQYIGSYSPYTDGCYGNRGLRTKMQRQLNFVLGIIGLVHGGCSLRLEKSVTVSFAQALEYVLTGNVNIQTRTFLESNVESILNQAIGNIENGTIPSRRLKPILPIKDETLRQRCSDLLGAPGSFDRVINQATQVLEDRLRTKLPFEKLCDIIPEAKNQIGETLAHKLLGPATPPIIVSDKPEERSAFHKMVVGMISYLRNPSHHSLSEDTEWSLAWSVVGIVDSLLSELDGSYMSEEKQNAESQPRMKRE